jgi:WNK lysine deficient protein kinase
LHTQKPNPIIHRDIKPENIFINSNEGEIRIGDLGLATVLSDEFSCSVLGTPEYMAPEIFEGRYDTAVDIYALGMTLLELATLETPYYEYRKNPVKIYKKLCEGIKPKNL